jgi:hypothetical protein
MEVNGILSRCMYAQRDRNWLEYLSEAGHMLPYILTAGHNTYGVCLPLYLKEMKSLPIVAPTVYTGFLKHGDFTVRRADGCHNGVSPDMVIEKSYDADIQHKTGLTCITLNPATRTQWLYT